MAKKINTTIHTNSTITCSSCNSEYKIDSVFENLKIDICGNCHPVFSGKHILIDTAGQLKRFQDRMAKSSTVVAPKSTKKTKVRRTIQTLADIENS